MLVALMATACGDGSTGTGTPEPTSVPEEQGEVWSRVDLPGLDDNVKHDTLLIQTTFDLGDSTYLMVASHVEETREGIRLYRYRVKPDSSAEVLSWSKPGYDSSTMLPTFFRSPDASQGWLLLANMGERESWGQEVFWLKDGAFIHMGYLSMAHEHRATCPGGTHRGCFPDRLQRRQHPIVRRPTGQPRTDATGSTPAVPMRARASHLAHRRQAGAACGGRMITAPLGSSLGCPCPPVSPHRSARTRCHRPFRATRNSCSC